MVKFGKKFFFNASYTKKTKRRTIIIGIIAIILLIVLICCLGSCSNKKAKKNKNKISNEVAIRKTLQTQVNSALPETVTYFEKISKIDISTVTVTYPEDMPITYNVDKCDEETKLKVNDILDGTSKESITTYECAYKMPSKVGEYDVTVTINKKDYSVKLKVTDDINPELLLKNVTIEAGTPYTINDFVESCTDNYDNECIINYYYNSYDNQENILDYSSYTEEGTYEIKIAATDTSGNITVPQTATLTINPKTPNKYLVTFDSNGGSSINGVYVEEGATVTKPTNPKRNNYTFGSWTLNGKDFDFSTPITSDITLVAKWNQKSNNDNQGSKKPNNGCTYGNMKYNSKYIIGVYANTSKCPASKSDATTLSAKTKYDNALKKDFNRIKSMYGSDASYQWNAYEPVAVYNTANTGIVGYQLECFITHNGVEIAHYKLDINGNRKFSLNLYNIPE